MKKHFYILITSLFVFFLFVYFDAQAADYNFVTDSGLNKTAEQTGHKDLTLANQSLPFIIGQLISYVLGFIGVIFLGFMIYAGYIWMFARGNESETEKAKSIIKNAIIGLIIVMLAYVITATIKSYLIK